MVRPPISLVGIKPQIEQEELMAEVEIEVSAVFKCPLKASLTYKYRRMAGPL